MRFAITLASALLLAGCGQRFEIEFHNIRQSDAVVTSDGDRYVVAGNFGVGRIPFPSAQAGEQIAVTQDGRTLCFDLSAAGSKRKRTIDPDRISVMFDGRYLAISFQRTVGYEDTLAPVRCR